jgi:hypothetical protein
MYNGIFASKTTIMQISLQIVEALAGGRLHVYLASDPAVARKAATWFFDKKGDRGTLTLSASDSLWSAVVFEWYIRLPNYDGQICWSKQGHAILDIKSALERNVLCFNSMGAFWQLRSIKAGDPIESTHAGLTVAVSLSDAPQCREESPPQMNNDTLYMKTFEALDRYYYETGRRFFLDNANLEGTHLLYYLHNNHIGPGWSYFQHLERKVLRSDQLGGLLRVAKEILGSNSSNRKHLLNVVLQLPFMVAAYADDARIVQFTTKQPVTTRFSQRLVKTAEGDKQVYIQAVDSYDDFFLTGSDCEDRTDSMIQMFLAIQFATTDSPEIQQFIDFARTYTITAALVCFMHNNHTNKNYAHIMALLIPTVCLSEYGITGNQDIIPLDSIRPSLCVSSSKEFIELPQLQHITPVGWPGADCQPLMVMDTNALNHIAVVRLFVPMNQHSNLPFHSIVPYANNRQGCYLSHLFASTPCLFLRPTMNELENLPIDQQFRSPPVLFEGVPKFEIVHESSKNTVMTTFVAINDNNPEAVQKQIRQPTRLLRVIVDDTEPRIPLSGYILQVLQ